MSDVTCVLFNNWFNKRKKQNKKTTSHIPLSTVGYFRSHNTGYKEMKEQEYRNVITEKYRNQTKSKTNERLIKCLPVGNYEEQILTERLILLLCKEIFDRYNGGLNKPLAPLKSGH